MPGGWVAVVVLILLLAGAAYVTYEGWTAHSGGIELPDWGYALLGVGVWFASPTEATRVERVSCGGGWADDQHDYAVVETPRGSRATGAVGSPADGFGGALF